MSDENKVNEASVKRLPIRSALRRWLLAGRPMARRVAQLEAVNFAITNRLIPRRLTTRLMGKLSQIEHPLVRDVSIGVWRLFTDLDLSDAKTQEFRSLHDCFIRELRPGARPIASDPQRIVSPCDGIVVGHGQVQGETLIQAKGSTYTLEELLVDPAFATQFRDGTYVTLRLTSAMYHRFHAPADCTVEHVTYVAGDTWNTNPGTLARVPKLYCKNERAVLRAKLTQNADTIAIVPVAAILVASIRLHFLDVLLHLGHAGPNEFAVQAHAVKGQELGYFQHGSTLVLIAPPGYTLTDNIQHNATIRMGQPLLHLPQTN